MQVYNLHLTSLIYYIMTSFSRGTCRMFSRHVNGGIITLYPQISCGLSFPNRIVVMKNLTRSDLGRKELFGLYFHITVHNLRKSGQELK